MAAKKATRKTAAAKTAAGRKTAKKAATKTSAGKTSAGKTSAAQRAGKKAASKSSAPKGGRRVRRRPSVPAERLEAVLSILAAHDPDPECELDHANAYELTAATILSAQCTDVRVNMVTPALFARYPTPHDLATAEQEDVEELVRTTGFFRNKAKNLIGMARTVVEQHGGEIPQTMEELTALPGVARKTANVVRGEIWGLADGVTVDTHVNRIAKRLGFTREDDPVQVERDLMRLLPHEHWIKFSHRIIRLGRSVCPARKPRCEECPLAEHCPKRGV